MARTLQTSQAQKQLSKIFKDTTNIAIARKDIPNLNSLPPESHTPHTKITIKQLHIIICNRHSTILQSILTIWWTNSTFNESQWSLWLQHNVITQDENGETAAINFVQQQMWIVTSNHTPAILTSEAKAETPPPRNKKLWSKWWSSN